MDWEKIVTAALDGYPESDAIEAILSHLDDYEQRAQQGLLDRCLIQQASDVSEEGELARINGQLVRCRLHPIAYRHGVLKSRDRVRFEERAVERYAHATLKFPIVRRALALGRYVHAMRELIEAVNHLGAADLDVVYPLADKGRQQWDDEQAGHAKVYGDAEQKMRKWKGWAQAVQAYGLANPNKSFIECIRQVLRHADRDESVHDRELAALFSSHLRNGQLVSAESVKRSLRNHLDITAKNFREV